jgi:hypothetical protein
VSQRRLAKRQKQRKLRMVTEFAALTVVTPFMLLLAANKSLSAPTRVAAGAVGAGTLIIDGVLLYSWLHKDPVEEGGYEF